MKTCDELDLYVPDQMTVCVIAPLILPVQFDGNFEAVIVISVIGWFGKPILTFDFGVLQPFDSTAVPWPAKYMKNDSILHNTGETKGQAVI